MIEGGHLFITGANRGLGRAFVQVALKLGAARIHAAARDPERSFAAHDVLSIP